MGGRSLIAIVTNSDDAIYIGHQHHGLRNRVPVDVASRSGELEHVLAEKELIVAHTGSEDHNDVATMRLRATAAEILPELLPLLLWLIVDGATHGTQRWAWATFLLVALINFGRVAGLPQITLTATEVIWHPLFRRRRVRWSQVHAITCESALLTRTVVLWVDGRPIPIRTPTRWGPSVRRFEERYHTVGRWWMAHRGPDWSPPQPPASSPDGADPQRPALANPWAPPPELRAPKL